MSVYEVLNREAASSPLGASKLFVCKAIIKKGGRITADDLARTWIEEMDPRRFFLSEQLALSRVISGIHPSEAGIRGIPDVAATMMIPPIGLINACDSEAAALDAFDVAGIFEEGYSRDSAGIVAAAVAEAVKSESTVNSVVNAAMSYARYEENRIAIQKAINLAKGCTDTSKLTEKLYEKLLVEDPLIKFVRKLAPFLPEDATVSFDVREQIPCALAMFYVAKGDPKETIIGCVNFGRDCDTIAGIAGGIAGAFKGVDEIPKEWIEIVTKANPDVDLIDISEKIYKIVKGIIMPKLKAQLGSLEKLINMRA